MADTGRASEAADGAASVADDEARDPYVWYPLYAGVALPVLVFLYTTATYFPEQGGLAVFLAIVPTLPVAILSLGLGGGVAVAMAILRSEA